MLIRLKKTADGVVLTCVRDNGAAAVQRTGYGGFFALHDLMHYAVETTLGFHEAFFGLMAGGWSFETFGDKSDPRYAAMPAQAGHAEHLVGILSRVYGDPAWHDPDLLPLFTDEVNRELATTLRAARAPAFSVSASQLGAIFERFSDLASRWVGVPLGGHLELSFPPANADRRRE